MTAVNTEQAIDLLAAIRTSRRSRLFSLLVAFVLGAGAGVGGWVAWENLDRNTAVTAEAVVELSTVSVDQRDMATYVEFDGSLGFSRTEFVTASRNGTLTAVATTGADLSRGDVLYEVDAQPVVLLYGELPTWRDLDTDSDDGRDILQLEANLWALGYTVDLDDDQGPYMSVDGNYDWATAFAVQLWETDLGLDDPDGDFEADLVMYLPGEIRVDEPSPLGTATHDGTSILTATVTLEVTDLIDTELATVDGQQQTSTEQVTLAVAIDEQSEFAQDEEVTIELSDGREALGRITEISEVARRLGGGANSQLLIDVSIEVIEIPKGGLLEGPVTIRLVDEQVAGITAVPVRALVALGEGGYAIEIRRDGSQTLTGVELGMFADGWVEVSGNVVPGDEVIVP